MNFFIGFMKKRFLKFGFTKRKAKDRCMYYKEILSMKVDNNLLIEHQYNYKKFSR